MTHLDLTPFYRSAIGFDRMANLVDGLFQTPDNSQPNWPPYNIEKKGETRYGITMASPEYLYRGIATRQFERRFQLADFIHIKGASLQDGLLHIDLEREVPEAMKPRKIDIVNQAKLTAPKK